MAGGGKQTVNNAPPAYQLPYLQSGLANAASLYDQGQYNVAPFSQQQTQAQQMIQNRATNGDPTIGAANDYVQKSLNGGFLGSNPYLDATFNQAAQATQGQLASQFAGSGRNVDQSAGLRSQQLNNLATQIYGGNYANERQLMQGTLGYAQPLGNQAYTDANQLNSVGQQIQDLSQKVTDAPGTALDQYLARVRGTDYGQTQTQKTPGNPVGGAIGGASVGSMFGPWGALGGAVLGGIFG